MPINVLRRVSLDDHQDTYRYDVDVSLQVQATVEAALKREFSDQPDVAVVYPWRHWGSATPAILVRGLTSDNVTWVEARLSRALFRGTWKTGTRVQLRSEISAEFEALPSL